jgi:hypothetical protein
MRELESQSHAARSGSADRKVADAIAPSAAEPAIAFVANQ